MAKERRLHVQPNRRRKPDYRKLSAALQVYLAAQAEADAEAELRANRQVRNPGGDAKDDQP
jgi:hypothetical protein